MRPFLASTLVAVATWSTACQPKESDRTALLWPGGAPGAEGERLGDQPRIYYYFPPPGIRTRTAVVVASGGSYGHHAGIDHEGRETARWLNEHGIVAMSVRYRVGRTGKYNHEDFTADGKRAVRTLRSQAEELDIDPDKIGMMGFSAGGHLASVVATQCPNDTGDPQADDPVERASCRIAFAVLAYPVITLYDDHAHRRSRNNMLRKIDDPPPALIERLSTHTQVTTDTAPTVLVHSKRDTKVDWQNSRQFHDALAEHGVPAKLMLFEDGRHGIGIADDPKRWPQMSTWPARLLAWLEERGLWSRPGG